MTVTVAGVCVGHPGQLCIARFANIDFSTVSYMLTTSTATTATAAAAAKVMMNTGMLLAEDVTVSALSKSK